MLKNKVIIILLLFLSIFINSCGYKIAGLQEKDAIKVYVNTVKNNSVLIDAGDIIQEEIEQMFLKYGMLSNEKNANYYTDITLDEIRISDSIISDTEEATSANTKIKLIITLLDINGDEVFTWNYEFNKTFSITSNVESTVINRNISIREAVNESLEDFRVKLNRELYK